MQNYNSKFKIIQKINKIFIDFILIVFYLIVIGFAHIIYRIFSKTTRNKDSYWLTADNKNLIIDFHSPY